jgi:hypothetical protein
VGVRCAIVRAIDVTGATTVTLRVYRDNLAALGLYSNLGFTAGESGTDDRVIMMSLCVIPRSSQADPAADENRQPLR